MTFTPPVVSAMLTSLPLPFKEAVRQAAELGFTHVDVVGLADRPMGHREALADAGVIVSCAAVGRDLPPGQSLDAASIEQQRAALLTVRQQIFDAAQLGATHAYVIPGTDTNTLALARFRESCCWLAEAAATRKVRLCVEHIPGRALPTVAATLEWLNQIDMDSLALLLDIGHCLISGEDPAEAVRKAGPRLGYVHLDDNDGASDLHWPLLAGRLTEESLRRFLAAVADAGYRAPVTLELNPNNPDPTAALVDGRSIVQRLWPLSGRQQSSDT
jgi:sugar phosphate isomerase/epimerase